jgi:hypothetical protein
MRKAGEGRIVLGLMGALREQGWAPGKGSVHEPTWPNEEDACFMLVSCLDYS